MELSLGAENRITIEKDVVLRRGDKGPAVSELQHQLLKAGYLVAVTSEYDRATEDAVRVVQRRNNLVVDGIAGPKTLSVFRNTTASRPLLSQADLQWAAGELVITLPSIMAVNTVESRGRGFLLDGRPVILYERHVMARTLPDYGIDPIPYITSQPGLVNKKRGGYAGGTKEHERLLNAKKICVEAALESTSWGAFQIMGFHWDLLGYPNVQVFVAEMYKGERQHLDAFVRFIKSQPAMHKALQKNHWERFAELYNGEAYRENKYHEKLEKAYTQYSHV